jgi:predicted membrane protein
MTEVRSASSRVLAPQLIIGLLLLIAGLALLLDNFGVLRAYYVLRLWPVGLIFIGLAMMAQAQRAAGRASGLFWTFIGTWLLLGNLDVLRLEIWDLWPVPLVIVGGYLIWQSMNGPDSTDVQQQESTFSALAVMGGVGRKLNTPDFRGGEATALLGGVKIDLRDAGITAPEAVIDVFAFWGGIEISVPDGWAVINRVVPVLGGADDRTRPSTDPAAKRLVIRGVCVMGGVDIKSA